MKKPIEVVMLPTGLPILKGQLAILDGKTSIYSFDMKDEHPAEAQYAYITVSQDVEPIKEGDYWVYICPINGIDYGDEGNAIVKNNLPSSWFDNLHDKRNYYKIIATTDPKLYTNEIVEEDLHMYKKPLPQVPQSFIEEFVANSNRKWEVEYEQEYVDGYTEDRVRRFYGDCKLKLNQDNEVSITSVEEKMYSLSDLEKLGDYAFITAKSTSDWNNWIKENL